MVQRFDNRAARRGIAVLFVLAGSWQIYLSAYVVRNLMNARIAPDRPFFLIPGTDRVERMDDAARRAGLQPGDEVMAIEGQPYRGESQVSGMLSHMHVRETLTVRARHPGQRQDVNMPIPLEPGEPPSALRWAVSIVASIVTPTFCMLLGFGVLLVRPRDPIAWLLLLMMLGFAQMSSSGDATMAAWELPAGWRGLTLVGQTFFQVTWPAWILLFGIYFPERLPLDRRFPWIKWVLLAPVAASAIAHTIIEIADADGVSRVADLRSALDPLTLLGLYAGMLSISGFFFSLGTKTGTASTADARRRIALLQWGASVALMPLFIVAIYEIAHGWKGAVPAYLFIPGILMLAVFPLTLAYVIVVQRALDVRVVVRQGLQYGLATRGSRILQGTVGVLAVWGAVRLMEAPMASQGFKLAMIVATAVLVINIRRVGDWLRTWIDRRFFREAYRAEQILGELSEKVRTMVETGPLLETVARQISRTLHVERVAMLIKSDGHYEPAYALGFAGTPRVEFDQQGATVERLKKSHEPLRVYFDDPDSWIYSDGAITAPERKTLADLDAQLLVPLSYGEKMSGIMSLGPKRSEEPYSKSDVQLLESVATQTGLALENSRLTQAIAAEVAQRERLNRELEIAREVQQRLFPQTHPAVPGLDYAGRCRPALGVGGDYYDFLELPKGQFGLAIGDVSGKGIPAALLMASLQASLRGQAINGLVDLAGMMANLNRLIFDATPSNRYATFFYGQYDPANRKLVYVNAGHNPPMVLRGAEVIRLDTGGSVIGLFPVARYEQAALDLQKGDVLVLFTDGISESMNAQDEEWGEEALEQAARQCDGMPAAGILERLIEEADAFAAGAPQHDDMTIVALRVV